MNNFSNSSKDEFSDYVRGMSYEDEVTDKTKLVCGMIYEEDEQKSLSADDNQLLLRGMEYLPEEPSILAEKICESISLEKNTDIIRSIITPVLAEGLARYGIVETDLQAVAKTNNMQDLSGERMTIPRFIPMQSEFLNFNLTLQRRVKEISDTEGGERVKEKYAVLITVFELNGAVKNFSTSIEADKIKQTEWLKKSTHSLATLPRRKEQRDAFDILVQECIEQDFVPEEIIYPTAGWRKIPNRGWRYVYRDGVVGEDDKFIHTGDTSKYTLDVKPEKLGSEEVFRASLNMCNVCRDKKASTELFLFTHATVMNTLFEQAGYMLNFVFGISGVTNSRKTSMVLALAKLFDRDKLIADAEFATATSCGIEKMLGLYKDAPVLIDDFKPGLTRKEQFVMDKKLDELVRLYGNRVAKKRMTDFSANPEKKYFPIEGGCILTMEIITGVTSSISRMFLTELQHDSVDNDCLRIYQEERWILPTYFYDFICWLTQNFENIVSSIREMYPQLRNYKQVTISRYAEMYATLSISAIFIGQYALARGFWSQGDAMRFSQEVDGILTCEISDMERRIIRRDKATLLLDILRDALEKGTLIPQVASPENYARQYVAYEDDKYLFIQTKELRRLADEYCKVYREHIEIVNDDEIFGLLERLSALEILERPDGKRERARKLPNPRGNNKRYLYIRKEVLNRIED